MKILVNPQIMMELEAIGAQTRGQEFSGFGYGEMVGDVFRVDDYILLHVGSETLTDIDTRQIYELIQRPDEKRRRLWFHRHPVGNGVPGPHNWSGMDENTIQTNPLGGIPEMVKWSCSMVRTPLGWVGRADNHITKQTRHVEVEPQAPVKILQQASDLLYARRPLRQVVYDPGPQRRELGRAAIEDTVFGEWDLEHSYDEECEICGGYCEEIDWEDDEEEEENVLQKPLPFFRIRWRR